METALVIVLEDAQPFDDVRREFDVDTVKRGIPFHLTLLYPFAPAEELSDAVMAEARSFFALREPIEFALTRVAAWPLVVYAVPEPDDALLDCMHALHALFPAWPPYGGAFTEVLPHATLGEDVDGPVVQDEIERRLAPHLPRDYRAEAATLLEEYAPDRWRERTRFPFTGRARTARRRASA